jgi:hypothetical protein
MQTTTLDRYGEREKSISTILAGKARPIPVLHVENIDHAKPLLMALENAGIAVSASPDMAVGSACTSSFWRLARRIAVGTAITGRPPPPAQIRTRPTKASGSYLGCLTSKRSSGQG